MAGWGGAYYHVAAYIRSYTVLPLYLIDRDCYLLTDCYILTDGMIGFIVLPILPSERGAQLDSRGWVRLHRRDRLKRWPFTTNYTSRASNYMT